MIFDYSKTSKGENYKLMSNSVIPRPIAWIVTQRGEVVNVAPFSYFTALSSKPATLIVSIGHKKSGEEKDTLKNIRELKKCVICMASEDFLEKLHLSSKDLPFEKSEAEVFDIFLDKILDDFPPMVKGVPVAFFCTLYQEIDLKESKTIPLVLEIKYQYVNDNIINMENFDINFNPLVRVGKSYAKICEKLKPPKI